MSISVVIPSYNRAALVVETLDSLLAQTRLPDEILVVDDGSTDDTRQAIAAYGSRVAYYYQENAGLIAARSSGLARVTGNHILMIDSDDLLRPTALARLEAALTSSPAAALAYCRAQTIDQDGKDVPPPWPLYDQDGDVWAQLIKGNFIMSTGAALIRRSFLDRIDTADFPYEVADWGMWLRLAELGPFIRVTDPLFLYRVHGASMSKNLRAMYWATYRLYRFFLLRYRKDHQRYQATLEAFRVVRDNNAAHLVGLAYRDRAEGDLTEAMRKLNTARRIQPRYLINVGVMRFYVGTYRRLRAVTRQAAH